VHGLGEFPLGVYVEGWVVWWVALSLWCVCGLGELGRSEGGRAVGHLSEAVRVRPIPRTGGVCRGRGLALETALNTDRARPGCRICRCVLQTLDLFVQV
jgi:hypothetical protein